MPLHCDSIDGPVVKAAIKALDSGDVSVVLPFVLEEGEAEVPGAFEKATKARAHSPEAKDVADRHFFETVVRRSTGRGKAPPSPDSSPPGSVTDPWSPWLRGRSRPDRRKNSSSY
jgi:hypothetical protein